MVIQSFRWVNRAPVKTSTEVPVSIVPHRFSILERHTPLMLSRNRISLRKISGIFSCPKLSLLHVFGTSVLLMMLTNTCWSGDADQGHAKQVEKVDFNRSIRPILAEHCFSCHGPDESAVQHNPAVDVPATQSSPANGAQRRQHATVGSRQRLPPGCAPGRMATIRHAALHQAQAGPGQYRNRSCSRK